jgi:hypothetical protein
MEAQILASAFRLIIPHVCALPCLLKLLDVFSAGSRLVKRGEIAGPLLSKVSALINLVLAFVQTQVFYDELPSMVPVGFCAAHGDSGLCPTSPITRSLENHYLNNADLPCVHMLGIRLTGGFRDGNIAFAIHCFFPVERLLDISCTYAFDSFLPLHITAPPDLS